MGKISIQYPRGEGTEGRIHIHLRWLMTLGQSMSEIFSDHKKKQVHQSYGDKGYTEYGPIFGH